MSGFKLDFAACIKINDEIWFSPTNCNGIYRYNLNSEFAERISEYLPYNEDVYYQKMCLYYCSLIFLPYDTNKILVLDMEDYSVRQITLPHSENNMSIYEDYGVCTTYLDALYVIGCAYPGIIRVDLKTFETTALYSILEKPKDFKGIYFGNSVAVNKNVLYIPCAYQNAVLACDMDKGTVSQISIGENCNRYSGIANAEQDFYLLESNTHCIIYWNGRSNTYKEINLNFRKNFVDAMIRISEKYVWVLSIIPGEVYQINRLNDEVRYIDLKREFSISYAEVSGDDVYFLDSCTCNWYKIDVDGILMDLHIQIKESRSAEEMWRDFAEPWLVERINFPIEYLFYQAYIKENYALNGKKEKELIGNTIWNKVNMEV